LILLQSPIVRNSVVMLTLRGDEQYSLELDYRTVKSKRVVYNVGLEYLVIASFNYRLVAWCEGKSNGRL